MPEEVVLDERTAKSIERNILFWQGSGLVNLAYYKDESMLLAIFHVHQSLRDYYLEQFRSVARWPVACFSNSTSFSVFYKLNGKERAAATVYPDVVPQREGQLEFDHFANTWREV